MLINKIWACEENALREYLETINSFDFSEEQKKAFFEGQQNSDDIDVTFSNGIASFSIEGILTKKGLSPIAKMFGFRGTSYIEIGKVVNRLIEDDTVKEVNIYYDTPGGDVSGVDETAQMLNLLKNKKKVTAYNTGQIASAGYYLASQASEIVSTSPNNETGSIGVIIMSYDSSMNSGVIRVTSKNAPLKNVNPSTEEGLSDLQRRADALERVFISRVASGRGVSEDTVINNFGRGSMMISSDPDGKMDDALSVGMIDKVKGIEEIKSGLENESIILQSVEEQVLAGATSFRDFPIADKTWDSSAAIKRVRKLTGSTEKPSAKYKNAFFWFDSKDKENFGAYKLPFVDVVDGKLHAIRRGVFAAKAAMAGARGGVNLPNNDRAAVNNHINKYVIKIEKQDKGAKKMKLEDLLQDNPGLTAEIEQLKKEAYNSGYNAKAKEFEEIAPYLKSDAYPDSVKTIGYKVLSGDVNVAMFLGAVAVVDSMKMQEEEKSLIVKTKDVGETVAENIPTASTDGIIRSDADIDLVIDEIKKIRA